MPDWQTPGFAGFADFTQISVVFQGFSDTSLTNLTTALLIFATTVRANTVPGEANWDRPSDNLLAPA